VRRLEMADPAWQTTFPFLVRPQINEWLMGLLLRCDEANLWGSGTTYAHILQNKTARNNSSLVVALGMDLDTLAQALALPLDAVVSTTYQAELAGLYDVADPHATFLSTSISFHLCPMCVAESRLLTRTLVLPHITTCPQHHILLVGTCLCGAPLRPLHRQASPFTCFKCGLDWAKLPRQATSASRIEIEERLLSSYDFFFTRRTPDVLASTLRLIYDSVVEKGEIRVPLEAAPTVAEGKSYQRSSSLGYLVHALWQLDLSPRDILIYAGPLPWRSVKWTRFQCPEPNCPYVAQIQDRVNQFKDHLN